MSNAGRVSPTFGVTFANLPIINTRQEFEQYLVLLHDSHFRASLLRRQDSLSCRASPGVASRTMRSLLCSNARSSAWKRVSSLQWITKYAREN